MQVMLCNQATDAAAAGKHLEYKNEESKKQQEISKVSLKCN